MHTQHTVPYVYPPCKIKKGSRNSPIPIRYPYPLHTVVSYVYKESFYATVLAYTYQGN